MTPTHTLVVESHVCGDNAPLVIVRQPDRPGSFGSIGRLFSSLNTRGDLQDMVKSLPETLTVFFNAKSCRISFTDELLGAAISTEPFMFPEKSAYVDEVMRKYDRNLVVRRLLGRGKPLLFNGVVNLEATDNKEHVGGISKSMMIAPILVGDNVVGAIYVRGPLYKQSFDEGDLSLLEAFNLFLAQSIRALNLQILLDSRLAKMAFQQPDEKNVFNISAESVPRLDKMARIVAKSFFREMVKAGFGAKHVINASSEIISELSKGLRMADKCNFSGSRGKVMGNANHDAF